jgi:hypothetical protein
VDQSVERDLLVQPVAAQEKLGRLHRLWPLARPQLRKHGTDLGIGAATVGYLGWVLLWQYTDFVQGRFGFHDLTLISDFFTNALHHGRPFWITENAVWHFTIHFTPTLIFLVPAFVFFKSQFALIAVVACVVAAGVFIATREQLDSLRLAGVPAFYRVALTAALFLLVAFNRYTLRCLASAHFEPVYIFTATLVLAAVRRGASHRVLVLVCLLALGVRQDTGLFLFFLLGSCLFAPESWTELRRVPVAAAAIGCGLYVLVATKFILPWFGSDVATRMWARWGETWPDVFMAWAAQPELVYKAIGDSEFLAFNAEFSFLHVVHGLAWLLNQLPSVLFYTADAWDKQRLAYYNTAFLLPGIILCLSFSQLYAVSFIQRVTKQAQLSRHLGLVLLTAAFGYAAVHTAFLAQREEDRVLAVGSLERTDVFAKRELKRLLRCKQVKSVAADFKNIVFAPLHLDKYLTRNATKADVVVERHVAETQLPFAVAPEQLHNDLQQKAYALAFNVDGYDVFLALGLKCP